VANPEHVTLVKQGSHAIFEWRHAHSEEILDLKNADLPGINLHGARLDPVDLTEANLSGADLAHIGLGMSNLSKANLADANLLDAGLRGANLTQAKLMRADLHTAIIYQANLSMADLRGAKLTYVTGPGANLKGANLSKADLGAALFFAADFSGANLREAGLWGTNLSGANLSDADLSQAVCLFTLFPLCDLSRTKGLESVQHKGPSSVGIETIVISFRSAGNKLTPELETFFRGAGVPKELLGELPRIISEVKYYSCFIAYGEPDKVFAEKLYKDLKARGVTCWLYSMDATPGKRTRAEIGQKRREAEKMIVLCSAQALVRDGVLNEIEDQIDEDPDKIVPISLDNLWKEPGFKVIRGNRDLKPFLLERNSADFSDPLKYEQPLERLLKGLKREKPLRHRGKRT